MTLHDVFAGATTDELRDEKAKRAVKAFRAMQPGLSGYARAITKRRDVVVELATSKSTSTDGKRIFIKPPMDLGDFTPHTRILCDKRDEVTLVQKCAACRIREDTLVNVYHEIAHIAYGTFEETTDRDKKAVLELAIAEYGAKYSKMLKQRIDQASPYQKSGYMGLSSLVSPFLPIILNSLEDARVDNEMFRARKGTKAMFDAMIQGVFARGVEQLNGEVKMWSEYPLNSQAMIGVFVLCCDYKFDGWFHPDVDAALRDPELAAICARVNEAKGVTATYKLSFPVLARLRELGFCRLPEDPDDEPQPEPEPEQEQEPDDEGDEGDGDTGNEPGDGDAQGESDEADESGGNGTGESDSAESADNQQSEDGSGGADSADGNSSSGGDESEPSTDEEERAGDSDSSDESESEGSGSDHERGGADQEGERGSEQESPDEPSDGDSRSQDGEDDNGEPDASDGGQGSSDDQSSESQGQSEDGEVDEDSSDDSMGSDSTDSGEAGEDSAESSESDGDGSAGTSDDSVSESASDGRDPEDVGDALSDGGPSDGALSDSGSDSNDTSEDGEVNDSGDGDRSGSQATGQGNADSDSDADGDVLPDGAPEQGDRAGDDEADGPESTDSEQPDTAGAEASDSDDTDTEAVDSGADEGEGGLDAEHADRPLYGDPDEVSGDIEVFSKHDIEWGQNPIEVSEDDKALDRAIVQSLYFETSSHHVTDVRINRHGDDTKQLNAWNVYDRLSSEDRKRCGIDADMYVDESVLGPALLETRKTFSDNQRGKTENHKRSGKVNAKVLGKRAHLGDDRLFKKKILPGKKSYSVVIGIDISGSTVGVNIALAKRAAMAQAELCDRVGIEFAVYGHTTGYTDNWLSDEFTMDMYEIKAFNEPWADKQRDALAKVASWSGNLDGHSIEYYRKLVEARPTTDKVILYYSDGKMPASNHDEELEIMQREIQYCKLHGITLMGVGIRTDSPSRHGLDTVQVDDDTDLVKVVRHLEKVLVRGR